MKKHANTPHSPANETLEELVTASRPTLSPPPSSLGALLPVPDRLLLPLNRVIPIRRPLAVRVRHNVDHFARRRTLVELRKESRAQIAERVRAEARQAAAVCRIKSNNQT